VRRRDEEQAAGGVPDRGERDDLEEVAAPDLVREPDAEEQVQRGDDDVVERGSELAKPGPLVDLAARLRRGPPATKRRTSSTGGGLLSSR